MAVSSLESNPLFAEWISSSENVLFRTGKLDQNSSILELGCGISPLNALALASKVARYVLTDQPYVHKFIQQNLEENQPAATGPRRLAKANKKGSTSKTTAHQSGHHAADIRFQVLDWETDQVTASLTGTPDAASFDAVVACDCVFNYALVQPFVQACVDICKLRLADSETQRPCLAIVAQQLRNDDVFRSWLTEFSTHFRVWRISDERLPEPLRPGAGFVVHVGVLKEYQ
ncbi:hypothetical protein PT974_00696 [Cladobotryum mycophilum]|uniref:Diaminohydroxyphosphoribosylamino-pyrimidine deaminase n=1 Tax=Cladobotryum mycophilum TaxID=491253 RepID=A0ABR0T1U5_9HYPO